MGIDPDERWRLSRGSVSRIRYGPPSGAVGVWADTHFALDMVLEVQKVVECERKGLMEYGAHLMEQDLKYAFANKVDPTTGVPWAPRKYSYPWPMLQRSGNLREVLDTGWGLKTRTQRPKIFGRVKDGYYVGIPGSSTTYTRHSRGQEPLKPNVVVAASTMYGRSKARGAGTGSKRWYTSPATGATVGRMFFGFSKDSERRFARAIELELKGAVA